MSENHVVVSPSSHNGEILSDLRRVDAHVIQAEEVDEIPEITEADLAEAVIKRPGLPDRPSGKRQREHPDLGELGARGGSGPRQASAGAGWGHVWRRSHNQAFPFALDENR